MRHLGIILGPVNQAHLAHGRDFIDAYKLGWPDVEAYKANLTTFFSLSQNFKYVWSSQCVYHPSDKYFSEITNQVIEKVRWATGDFDDAFTGFRNFIQNIPVIKSNSILNESFSFKAQSVAIVGAGPSLDSQLTELKKYKGLVVAVDAAAHKLEKEGINYHLIFSTERQPQTAATLRGLNYENRILICPYVIHPDSLDAWKGKSCFYASAALPYSYQIFPINSVILSSPVVGSSALLGCNNQGIKNIALFGYDFTYGEDGKTHTDVHENVSSILKSPEFEVATYNGTGRTNFIWHSAAVSLATVLNVIKDKPQVWTMSKNMFKIKGVSYRHAQKWRLSARPGYEFSSSRNDWNCEERVDLIREDLKTKTSFDDFEQIFNGPAGSVIRMLTLRAFIRYESFTWSDEENKSTYKKDFILEIEKAVEELSKIL